MHPRHSSAVGKFNKNLQQQLTAVNKGGDS